MGDYIRDWLASLPATAHDYPHYDNGPRLGAPFPAHAVCVCTCGQCCGHRSGTIPATGEPGRCTGCSCYLTDASVTSLPAPDLTVRPDGADPARYIARAVSPDLIRADFYLHHAPGPGEVIWHDPAGGSHPTGWTVTDVRTAPGAGKGNGTQ